MEFIDNKKWCVYIHTFPNDKKYVGITCRNPLVRWGRDGGGYRTQHIVWQAIQEFGWNNIRHEIIKDNLSEEDAKNLEKELIIKYQTTSIDYGYNSLGMDNKVYSSINSNLKRPIIEVVSRQMVEVLSIIFKLNAVNKISAITMNVIEENLQNGKSHTTTYRSLITLYENNYIDLGLKYGKLYSYYITDQGIDLLEEFELI